MKLTLVSDFNIEMLGRFLNQKYQVEVAPFNQVHQTISTLIQNSLPSDGSVIWVQPQAMISGYAKALELRPFVLEEIFEEIDQYATQLTALAKQSRFCLVSSWTLPIGHRGYGMLDWKPKTGLAHLMAQMNLRLTEKLQSSHNVFVLDSDRWTSGIASPNSPKLWYATKTPYSADVFKKASLDVDRAIQAIEGKSRKIILLDLDNTLWGGVVGETGWTGLRLGGHDHVGEAFRAFQAQLKSLTARGIQLALVSKNEQSVAFEAIENHPEMLLKKRDFAGWRINWQDKAQNIVELLEELRLGQSSAVFIDDNPAERDRVRGALPELLVPEWPSDPAQYVRALQDLGCFDTAHLSDEDRNRSAMYAAERDRRVAQTEIGSSEKWLQELKTEVRVDPVSEKNILRVGQLFNKTNQLNLSTRRLGDQEILNWANHPERALFAFTVSDKFGELGLSGVLGVEQERQQVKIVDFILSCRVMGRQIESAMFFIAANWAHKRGAKKLSARYLPTERNVPTLEVFKGLQLNESEPGLFSHEQPKHYTCPASVGLVVSPGILD